MLESGVQLLLPRLGRAADRGGRRRRRRGVREQGRPPGHPRRAWWSTRTGDGDIFARAGAAFDNDIEERDVHHCMNTVVVCSAAST